VKRKFANKKYEPRHFEQLNLNILALFVCCCSLIYSIHSLGFFSGHIAITSSCFIAFFGLYALHWEYQKIVQRRQLIENVMPEDYWYAVENDCLIFLSHEKEKMEVSC